jgi:hypothetical protein
MFTKAFALAYRAERDNGKLPLDSWLYKASRMTYLSYRKPLSEVTDEDWQELLMIGAASGARSLTVHFRYVTMLHSGPMIREAARRVAEPFKEVIDAVQRTRIVQLVTCVSCRDQMILCIDLFTRDEISREVEQAERDRVLL